ncbi:MAG: DMT family transporter [Planctomycetaceae bacterium]|nr:DMT family transporter [Planctomycetaceae bacterium]
MPDPTSAEQKQEPSQAWFGFLLAFGAAILYTFANIAFRDSARPGDLGWSIWVTAHRAVPATIIAWSLIFWNHAHGRPAFPPRGLLLPLIATGLVMQFGGNLMFQTALGLIGLAMTVPLTFAMILLSGATCSRFFLGEPLTYRSLIVMLVLMGAVTLLSFGAGAATKFILEDATPDAIFYGVGSAMLSGIGYGVAGVSIRRNVKNLPVSATLVLISSTGLVCMGLLTFALNPLETILATTPGELLVMQLAGLFNGVAFFAIGNSYRFLRVNQVNMINTTQIAMASLAGVLAFSEPVTIWLVLGILLTMSGLIAMERK